MKILITGDEGFVGRYFHKLYDDENEVIGIDVKSGQDVRNFFKTDDTKFNLVIHLAAIVGGRATIEGSPLSVAVDLSIDSEMFNWALRTRPDRIIYFSSSAAYPTAYQDGMTIPLKERYIDLNNIRSPDLTYGWSKLTGEYLAKFAEAEGLKINIFRPFSGYGTDQDLDYPFPSFIRRAQQHADPFEIWGNGRQVRDWIHITDIVHAVDEAIKQDIQEPVNLGWGIPISFNELANLITKMADYSPDFKYLDKPTGVHYRVCNPDKMLSFYTPKVPLELGIQLALDNQLWP